MQPAYRAVLLALLISTLLPERSNGLSSSGDSSTEWSKSRQLTASGPCPAAPSWPTPKSIFKECPGKLLTSYSDKDCRPLCSDTSFNVSDVVVSIRIDGPLGSQLGAIAGSTLGAVQQHAKAAYAKPTGDVYSISPLVTPRTPPNVVVVTVAYNHEDIEQPGNPSAPVSTPLSTFVSFIGSCGVYQFGATATNWGSFIYQDGVHLKGHL